MRALELVTRYLRDVIQTQGSVRLALPGGRSAINLMQGLVAVDIDWRSITVTLVDERAVPLTDSGSNAALVHQTLLEQLAVKPRFEPLFIDATAAAAATRLNALHQPLDVVVLGMGEDGHFASLFPSETPVPGLTDGLDGFVSTPPVGSPEVERISMSLNQILSATLVILLVSSDDKRARVTAGLNGLNPQNPISYLLASDRPIYVSWPDDSMHVVQKGVMHDAI